MPKVFLIKMRPDSDGKKDFHRKEWFEEEDRAKLEAQKYGLRSDGEPLAEVETWECERIERRDLVDVCLEGGVALRGAYRVHKS